VKKEAIDKIFEEFEKNVHKMLKKQFGIDINKVPGQHIEIIPDIKNRRIDVYYKAPSKPYPISVKFDIDIKLLTNNKAKRRMEE
jgi:hypothetical protein